MNVDSNPSFGPVDAADTRPLLIVPYNWIGDFVRGHTVVRVAKQRWPNRPIDILTTPLCAPLVDYMPGVRKGIVHDLPRSRLTPDRQWRLAQRLRREPYRPCARRSIMTALSNSAAVENMQPKPPRADVAAASSELSVAWGLRARTDSIGLRVRSGW